VGERGFGRVGGEKKKGQGERQCAHMAAWLEMMKLCRRDLSRIARGETTRLTSGVTIPLQGAAQRILHFSQGRKNELISTDQSEDERRFTHANPASGVSGL
jgi:hypothetical protein